MRREAYSKVPPSDASVKVGRNMTYLILSGIVEKVGLLAYFIVATRYLPTVQEFGRASILTLISGLIPILVSLAIPSALTRYIALYDGRGDKLVVKGLILRTLKLGFAIGFIASGIFFIASPTVSVCLLEDAAYANLTGLFSVHIFFTILNPFLSRSLQGIQKFKEIAFASSVHTTVKYSSIIILLLYGFELYGIILGWIITSATHTMLIAFYLFRNLPNTRSRSIAFRELLDYSLPLYASGIVSYLTTTLDSFIMLALAGNEALGLYRPAVVASGAVGMISLALSQTLFPKLTELTGRHGENSLIGACKTASRYIFLTYTPLGIGLATISQPLLTLLAGERYGGGASSLTLLSISMTLTSTSILLTSVLLSQGRTRVILYTNVMATLGSLAASVTLIPQIGILGAAAGKTASLALTFTIPAYALAKSHKLNLDTEVLKKALASSTVMAVAVLTIEKITLPILLIPQIIVAAITYTLALRLLKAVNQRDIDLIKQYLPKRINGAADHVAKLLIS